MERGRSDLGLLKGFASIAGGADVATAGILMGGGKILALLDEEEVIGTTYLCSLVSCPL